MQLVFTKTGEDNVNEIFASLRGATFVQSEKDDEYDVDSEPDEEESMIQSQVEERKVGDEGMIMS